MNSRLSRGSLPIGALFVFALSMLRSGEAHVGQIHYDEIELKDVVRQSMIIVVAEKAGDPELRTVVTEGVGRDGKTQKVSFTSAVQKYRVLEVLKGKDALSEAEREFIIVGSATLHSEYALTLRYELEGVTKSPIYPRYAGSATDKDTKVILYLDDRLHDDEIGPSDDAAARSPFGRAFAGVRPLTATGAMDSSADLEKVKVELDRANPEVQKRPPLAVPAPPRVVPDPPRK